LYKKLDKTLKSFCVNGILDVDIN